MKQQRTLKEQLEEIKHLFKTTAQMKQGKKRSDKLPKA